MSFSALHNKVRTLSTTSPVRPAERRYASRRIKPCDEIAVDMLVDAILELSSRFTFKEPLTDHYDSAREHALNCLDHPIAKVQARHVKFWISEALKCFDCTLIVYLRDQLGLEVKKTSRQIKERDIYSACESVGGGWKAVGKSFHQIYSKRNGLEHIQVEEVKSDGKTVRVVREPTTSQKLADFTFCREEFRHSLQIILAEYKSAYPDACKGRKSRPRITRK